MATGVRYCTIIAAACILLPGCSTAPQTGIEAPSTDRHMPIAMDPGTNPGLDHFIARLPYKLADTATEERAMTHVAIGRAKAKTGSRQCGRAWLITGPASDSIGPHLATRAGAQAWYYRLSHQPGLAGCDNASREALYDSLQDSLPAWITLQRAGPAAPAAGNTLIKASR